MTRIYEVEVEHAKEGLNWNSFRLASKTFEQALAEARKLISKDERITEIKMLAHT